MIARRTLIKGASMAALAATASALSLRDSNAQQVPNSSGTAPAKLKAPAGACDCHQHIYDAARFPPANPSTRVVPNARVEDYRLLQRRIGTTRNIIVTPTPFPATLADNLVTLDAIKQFGANARGVAIIGPTISDADLKTMHDGGIRGVRFTAAVDNPPTELISQIEPLAKRIANFGWHVQINLNAATIIALEDLWNRLPVPLVIDHMGHIRQPQGIEDPAFTVIRRMLDKGNTWVKLSVTYDSSKDGPPGYADVNKVGMAYVRAAPERLVWGSNWPHPNETSKPDDATLFDLVMQWAPNEAARNRILVQNAATLYGFTRSM
jgi:D-galactarolactone isomerase